jgi:hypothetical protein
MGYIALNKYIGKLGDPGWSYVTVAVTVTAGVLLVSKYIVSYLFYIQSSSLKINCLMVSDGNWRFRMSDVLRNVLNVFPDTDELIHRLYARDDDFKLLCRDYTDALKAIQTWRQSVNTEASKRVLEYQSLVGELQKDIRQYLEKSVKK